MQVRWKPRCTWDYRAYVVVIPGARGFHLTMCCDWLAVADNLQWKGARASWSCAGVDFIHDCRFLGIFGHVRARRDGGMATARLGIYRICDEIRTPLSRLRSRMDLLVQVRLSSLAAPLACG